MMQGMTGYAGYAGFSLFKRTRLNVCVKGDKPCIPFTTLHNQTGID